MGVASVPPVEAGLMAGLPSVLLAPIEPSRGHDLRSSTVKAWRTTAILSYVRSTVRAVILPTVLRASKLGDSHPHRLLRGIRWPS